MVLMFIAIDVIILLVYDIYSATQGTLEAILLRNGEKIREEIGVWDWHISVLRCYNYFLSDRREE